MNDETVPPLDSINPTHFSTTVEHVGDTVSVRLIGTAHLEVKGVLDEFLARTHERALAGNANEVVVDFRALRFMNSSCLRGLVSWICSIQALPPARRYRVVLVSSPDVRWQRRSLRAVWALAADLVTIRT